jgi:hypothetical protein
VSSAEELGDLKLVTKRLLRNPADFGDVLKEFYGLVVANDFKNLLEQHLLIAADLVNAAKSGNSQAVEGIRVKWYQNANQIAEFLGRVNPYWDREEWQTMFYEHLRLVESEAIYRLRKQYEEDIKLYDYIENQALKMADEMSVGIISQFNI